MKNLDNSFLLSLVILFPFISGLVRLKNIRNMYLPFIALIAVATVTELASFVTIKHYENNSPVINIYSLAEYGLIIYQFYCWRYYSRTKKWYPVFGVFCMLIWIIENLVIGHITYVGPVFRVSSAFVLVILSINEINYLLIHENRNLLKNARFLICTGFLIYFLYQILLEGSIYISQQEKNATADRIIELSMYINALANIVYGIAAWLIPKKTLFNFKNAVED